MAETPWQQLEGDTLQYGGHQWELTGGVDVRDRGSLLAVEAKQVDDVSQPMANLRFASVEGSPALNPDDLDEMFCDTQRERDGLYIVLQKEPQRYRYELLGIERVGSRH